MSIPRLTSSGKGRRTCHIDAVAFSGESTRLPDIPARGLRRRPRIRECHAARFCIRRGTGVPVDELYKVASDSAILSAARALMLSDSNVAVVTLDSIGQPRVRTTKAFVSAEIPGDPAKSVTVWIMTRLTTRKVEQVRRHPQVTLYFNDDDRVEYATVMGSAIIHTDATNPEAKKFYEDGYAEFFWPDFPKDFVMIEVKPRWLEYLGPEIAAHPQTWRPQAVVFDSASSVR